MSESVNNDPSLDESVWETIKEWPHTDLPGVFAFIRARWYLADWGWHERDRQDSVIFRVPVRRYRISTAGWSDNEWLISALQHNAMVWMMCWVESRRGGHYLFEHPLPPAARGGETPAS